MPFGIKREPQTRVGLVTSSLPRKRSTTELLRLVFALSLFEYLRSFWSGVGVLLRPAFLERKTGLEPATYSLEGYRSTKWATSASLEFWYFVGEGGLEPPNSSEDRFTVCCNCRYATPPILLSDCSAFWVPVSSRWRDSNPRQADYKSATLPTELHRLLSTFQTTLFLDDWGCKDTTFFKYNKSFFQFFSNHKHNNLIIISIYVDIFLSHPSVPPAKYPLPSPSSIKLGPKTNKKTPKTGKTSLKHYLSKRNILLYKKIQ